MMSQEDKPADATLVPYMPPTAPFNIRPNVRPSDEAPPGRFAMRVSICLAALGMALFAGAVLAPRWIILPESVVGFGLMTSVASHLVGATVVFAAPRGRKLGFALNLTALLLIAALIVLGLRER